MTASNQNTPRGEERRKTDPSVDKTNKAGAPTEPQSFADAAPDAAATDEEGRLTASDGSPLHAKQFVFFSGNEVDGDMPQVDIIFK